MASKSKNPNKKKANATSFGRERANPQAQHCLHGAAPGSIRNAMKRLLAVEIDLKDPDSLKKAAAFCSTKQSIKGVTGYFVAASVIQQALDGSLAVAKEVADSVEGRLQDHVSLSQKVDTTITYKNRPLGEDEEAAAIQAILRVAEKFKPTTKEK